MKSSIDQRIHTAFNDFLTSRFDAKRSLNVVLAFPYRDVENQIELCTEETVQKTLRLLHNKLNQLAFGNASRRKRAGQLTERSNLSEIAFTAALHKHPHRHVHCQIEIPKEFEKVEFSNFIREFAEKNRWIANVELYIEDTKSNTATQKYNSRYGTNSIILF